MPEINFDNEATTVFEEIKDLPPLVYRKLFSNDEIVRQIFPIIFPEGTVLEMLINYFITKRETIYNTLARMALVNTVI